MKYVRVMYIEFKLNKNLHLVDFIDLYNFDKEHVSILDNLKNS